MSLGGKLTGGSIPSTRKVNSRPSRKYRELLVMVRVEATTRWYELKQQLVSICVVACRSELPETTELT